MRRSVRFVLVLALGAISFGAWAAIADAMEPSANASRAQPIGGPALELLRAGEVKPMGWIRKQLELDLHHGLPGHYDKVSNAVNLHVFERQNRPAGGFVEIPGERKQKSWWSGEHEGYWKDAVVRMAFLVDDEPWKRRAGAWMAALLQAQGEDGYIGPYSPETRFPTSGENGELWAQSRIFQAMLAYHEFTGEKAVLDAVGEAVRLTLSKYGDGSYFGARGGQGGLTHGVGFMDTLEWLYRLTGDDAFRNGAVWLYEDFQRLTSQEMHLDRVLDVNRPWRGHTPHIMEGLHMAAIAYRLTGNPTYRRAAANTLVKFDRHANPGGGVVGDEAVRHRDGSADMPAEYCTMTEGVTSLNRIVAWLGDLSVADRVERVCLNAAQGARFHPANRAVCYLSKDNQKRADVPHYMQRYLYSAWHEAAACCTLNSGRLLPYYVEGMWYRDASRNALVKCLYGPCRVRTAIGDRAVEIVEKTDFPFSDRVVFALSAEQPVQFTLVLRLPAGAGDVQVEAGPEAEIRRDGRQVEIAKTWADGDQVAVDFDFAVRRVLDRNGELYHRWGPLVFSLPLGEERKPIKEFAALDGRPSGFHMWEVRPLHPERWSYRLAPDTTFTLAPLSEGSVVTPWADPPIGLRGSIRDGEDRPVEVTLTPLGCSLLRRTTFPGPGK